MSITFVKKRIDDGGLANRVKTKNAKRLLVAGYKQKLMKQRRLQMRCVNNNN